MISGFIYAALEDVLKSQTYFKEALSIAEKYPNVPFAQKIIADAKKFIKN
jgi:hypothetical protein